MGKKKNDKISLIIRLLEITEKQYHSGNIDFDYIESIIEDEDKESLLILSKNPELFNRLYQLYDKLATAVSQELIATSRHYFTAIPKKELALTPQYELVLDNNTVELQPEKVYISFEEKSPDIFYYRVLDFDGIIQKSDINITKLEHWIVGHPLCLEQLNNVKSDILKITAKRGHTQGTHPKLDDYARYYNYISDFPTYQILLQKHSFFKRTLIIERWILILKKCYEAKDYNSAFAIYMGLESPGISRLSKGISDDAKATLLKVGEFTECGKSRDLVKNNLFVNDAIPFIGFYQSQIDRLKDADSLSRIDGVSPTCTGLQNKDEKFDAIHLQIAVLQYCSLVIHKSQLFNYKENLKDKMYVYKKESRQLQEELCKKYKEIIKFDLTDSFEDRFSFFSSKLESEDFKDLKHAISLSIQSESLSAFNPALADMAALRLFNQLSQNARTQLKNTPDYIAAKKKADSDALFAENLYRLFMYVHAPSENSEKDDDVNQLIKKQSDLALHYLTRISSVNLRKNRLNKIICSTKTMLSEKENLQEHQGLKLLVFLYNLMDFIALSQSKTVKSNLSNQDIILASDSKSRVGTNSILIEVRKEERKQENYRHSVQITSKIRHKRAVSFGSDEASRHNISSHDPNTRVASTRIPGSWKTKIKCEEIQNKSIRSDILVRVNIDIERIKAQKKAIQKKEYRYHSLIILNSKNQQNPRSCASKPQANEPSDALDEHQDHQLTMGRHL